jgi:hypothetical protein
MKLTMRKKAFLVAGAVALSALIVDRAFLNGDRTGPKTGQAAVGQAFEPVGRRPAQNRPDVAKASPPRLTLPGRLARACSARTAPAGIRDAFAMPAPWAAELRAEVATSKPAAPVGEAFRTRHRLTAVMVDSAGGQAIVDGRCLKVGQSLDGFVLSSVQMRAVVFTNDEGSVELRLPEFSPAEGRE